MSVDSGSEYTPPSEEEEADEDSVEEAIRKEACDQTKKRKRRPANKKYKGESVSIFNPINE